MQDESIFPRGRVTIMGVLNATPDSFSDGGKLTGVDSRTDVLAALRAAEALLAGGAHILDVGGESTRPGAPEISEAVEQDRVIPLVASLVRELGATVSIDTRKAGVARAAIDAGATIVNDISGLRHDPAVAEAVARTPGVSLIVGHIRGTPADMQDAPGYDDVLLEVATELESSVAVAREAGIADARLAIDPGIGFGKGLADNLQLIAHAGWLGTRLGLPVLVGPSRKSFLGRITGDPVDQREAATQAACAVAAFAGADAVRVHAAADARRAVAVGRALRDARRKTIMIEYLWEILEEVGSVFAGNFDPIRDTIDILLVTAGIYWILLLIRGTRAVQILVGLLVLIALSLASEAFDFATLGLVLQSFLGSAVVIMVILFQQDIRRALARVGRGFFPSVSAQQESQIVEDVIRASQILSQKRIGALIVLERETALDDQIEAGLKIDALVSKELLLSIFHTSSPLHDGAVIIQDGRVSSVGCILPLTLRGDLPEGVGTRHRAAVGITEETDAVVIVVSEETASISVVMGGEMIHGLDAPRLRVVLRDILSGERRELPTPAEIGKPLEVAEGGETLGLIR